MSYKNLKVGDEVRISITGYVTAVDAEYTDIETGSSWSSFLVIDEDWDVEKLD